MGRTRKPKEDEREPLTNVGALNDAVIKAFNEMLALDRQIDEETERHLKPLKEAKTKTLRNLKADTTISSTDINLFYRMWKRQQQAIEGFVDEADKDKVLDDMRTLFNALADGEMLDFVDLLEADAEEHVPAAIAGTAAVKAASVEEEEAEAAAAANQ